MCYCSPHLRGLKVISTVLLLPVWYALWPGDGAKPNSNLLYLMLNSRSDGDDVPSLLYVLTLDPNLGKTRVPN
jgi:hypothetical protein